MDCWEECGTGFAGLRLKEEFLEARREGDRAFFLKENEPEI